MNHPFTRGLALILAALLLLPLVSCANSQNDPDAPEANTVADPTAGVEAEAETEPRYLDALPETLDYGGYEVNFLSSEETKSIELDEETDDISDVVNEAYWKRNRALEERLNVKLVLGEKTGYGNFNSAATQAVAAGSDEYDLFCAHTRFNVSLAASGQMMKLNENGVTGIVNINAPYWSQLFIENINYKDNIFWVTGDMTHSFISYIYAMFVNATVWNDFFPGESIYGIVLEGGWTLDKMSELCENVYRDLNGNAQVDLEDCFGVIMQKGHVLNGMVFANGVEYTGRDDDGNYTVILGSEHTVDVFDKLHTIFYATDYGYMFENAAFDNGSITMLNEDRVLFCPNTFGMAGNEIIRNMDSDFMIIPLPKFDEEQENYRVNQYDGVPLYGCPTTLSTDKIEMIATVLEATCSMTSQIVIPAYYDLALKNKYSRDAETAKMIDLIHDCITADFCFYWGDSVGDLMSFFYNNIQNSEISSKFKSNEKVWAKTLTKLIGKLEG